MVLAEADDARTPHPGRLSCDLLHDLQDAVGVLALLRVGDPFQKAFDADFGRLCLGLSHDKNPRARERLVRSSVSPSSGAARHSSAAAAGWPRAGRPDPGRSTAG